MRTEEHAILLNEIRYAQRLCQRTARLYRRASALFTFTAILGGSGLASSLAHNAPPWLVVAGGVVLAASGAAALAMRPLEKALANDMDVRRYAALETRGLSLDAEQLRQELAKTREADVPEIELLRPVAYNDVVLESGRPDLLAPLSLPQKLAATLA